MMLEFITAFSLLYLIVGLILTLVTKSRGLKADMLFIALWPLYLGMYVVEGRNNNDR